MGGREGRSGVGWVGVNKSSASFLKEKALLSLCPCMPQVKHAKLSWAIPGLFVRVLCTASVCLFGKTVELL